MVLFKLSNFVILFTFLSLKFVLSLDGSSLYVVLSFIRITFICAKQTPNQQQLVHMKTANLIKYASVIP